MYRLQQLQKQLPTVHLAAVSACVFILGLTLLMLPSQSVEATRNISATSSVAAVISTPESSQQSPHAVDNEIATGATTTKGTGKETGDETVELIASSPSPLIVIQPAAPADNWIDYKVGPGDNLTSMFKKAGLSATDVYYVAKASQAEKAFTRLHPGQTLSFVIRDNQLVKLKHRITRLKSTLLTHSDAGYKIEQIERKPEVKQQFATATIQDSLFLAGEAAGLSNKKIMELASIFGWDVDFVLDIRKGDSFNLIYEEHFLDGKKIGEGPIVAAQFTNRGQAYTAVRYTDAEGNSSYYTPEGYSMRKAFLRSPVGFARISSRFSLKRKHPVLNTIRAHKGVDYAAPTGTPIKAAGDGKIIFRGRKGGFGNVVILQHGSNITTLYAHMKNFKRGQKRGSKVKQGDVIGYVGRTGLASGPHLHYEFRVNGVHKNPLTVKLPTAQPISPQEHPAFINSAEPLLAQLKSRQATTLALNSQ